jgi:hypothetical protein
MTTTDELIPRPPVVRDRLARSLRETRLLKRLLRLSIAAAAEERQRQTAAPPDTQPEAARPEEVAP